MFTEKSSEIAKSINNYFEGIFYGDTEKLRNVFYPKASLHGDINNQDYLKNVDEYLEGVENRKSPNDMGEEFKMEILSIEILGNIATAKLHVPMLGYNYYDYLSFSKINNEWKIVNKLFAHVA